MYSFSDLGTRCFNDVSDKSSFISGAHGRAWILRCVRLQVVYVKRIVGAALQRLAAIQRHSSRRGGFTTQRVGSLSDNEGLRRGSKVQMKTKMLSVKNPIDHK